MFSSMDSRVARALAGDRPATLMPSAGTVDIGKTNTRDVVITGTTAITSLGRRRNSMRTVRFSGALTLTYNATSLVLPTSANITTASGDTAIFISDNSGNWRCISYTRANGQALAPTSISWRVWLGGVFNTTPGVIPFDTKTGSQGWDTAGIVDVTVHVGRVTPTLAGKYRITGQTDYNANSGSIGQAEIKIQILRNGGVWSTRKMPYQTTSGVVGQWGIDDIVTVNGTTDYIEVGLDTDTGGGQINNAPTLTYMTGNYVGP